MLEHTDLSQPCTLLVSGTPTRDQDQFLEDVDVLLDSYVQVRPLETIPPALDLGSGLLALLGGDSRAWLRAFEAKRLDESVLTALSEGGVVLAAPGASSCLGSWILPSGGEEVAPGLGWLPGAVVLPGQEDPIDEERVRLLLKSQDRAYALGLPTSSILALGPQGQVEVWGETAPKLALGTGWG